MKLKIIIATAVLAGLVGGCSVQAASAPTVSSLLAGLLKPISNAIESAMAALKAAVCAILYPAALIGSAAYTGVSEAIDTVVAWFVGDESATVAEAADMLVQEVGASGADAAHVKTQATGFFQQLADMLGR